LLALARNCLSELFRPHKEIDMRKALSSLVAISALCSGVPQAIASDLVDTAASSGEIKTFVAALQSAGIADSLKHDGPYTVFAPADSAFDKLPANTRDELMKDKKKLAQVLAYHVIPGKVLVSEVKPGKVPTIQGSPLTIKSDNGKVTVDEANVTQSDVTADNGVIHVIDTVVLPKQ
jgi:uncharacterized surface protein with fasciclin (FAS1) repeats